MYSNTRPTERSNIISAYCLPGRPKQLMAPNMDDVFKIVCDYFRVEAWRILSKSRKRNVANARFVAMYIIRQKCDLSLKAIGCFFNKDHTSVIHAIRFIEGQLSIPETNNFLEHINNINISISMIHKQTV